MESPVSKKLILRIDASALKESACMLRFYRIVVEGYCHSALNNDIVYGVAFHKFIQTMYQTGGDYALAFRACDKVFEQPTIVKPKKDHLNPIHCKKVATEYWNSYLLKSDFEHLTYEDGKPAVEITFSVPYYEDEEIIVMIEGTIDKTGKIKNGCYANGDYKTTSMVDEQEYFRSYPLSTQLLTYLWAIKRYGIMFPDSVLGKIAKSRVGSFIEGIFVRPDWLKSTFVRSEVFMLEDKLPEYEMFLERVVMELVSYVKSRSIPLRHGIINNACIQQFGKCRFYNVCAAPGEIASGHILKVDFVRKEYKPLEFGGTE